MMLFLLFLTFQYLLFNASGEKIHIYVLAGQSNMVGHGLINATDTHGNQKNGTLLYQLSDPRTKDEFQILWDTSKNEWRTLEDVKIWFNQAGEETGENGSTIPGKNGEDYSAGSLKIGYGAGRDDIEDDVQDSVGSLNIEYGAGWPPNGPFFGPEIGFGFNLDIPAGDKVLLIKTAWGGKDLARDYRPPTSATTLDRFCVQPNCDPFVVGHFYHVMLQDVKKLLKPGVIGKIYPDLANMTAELSGFGWFQGWNDGCDANYTAAYETNMVHLIQDLRRAWNNPHLPVSIGISGFFGWDNIGKNRGPPGCWDGPNATKINCNCDRDRGCRRIDIILSQMAAANLTKHPELECCVEAVETRDFWRPKEYSPSGQEYHFNWNAESHYLIGKAMAEGMSRAQQAYQNYKGGISQGTRQSMKKNSGNRVLEQLTL